MTIEKCPNCGAPFYMAFAYPDESLFCYMCNYVDEKKEEENDDQE